MANSMYSGDQEPGRMQHEQHEAACYLPRAYIVPPCQNHIISQTEAYGPLKKLPRCYNTVHT